MPEESQRLPCIGVPFDAKAMDGTEIAISSSLLTARSALACGGLALFLV